MKELGVAVFWLAVVLCAPRSWAECSAVCDPEVSKPCGLVCISKHKRCHKPTTSACMGKAGRSTKKTYDNPQKVEPAEQQKANDASEG